MDFMSDALHNKTRFRTFNVIDDFNREALGLDIGTGIPAKRVTRYLDQLALGSVTRIKSVSTTVLNLRQVNLCNGLNAQVIIDYIKPGCPYQNAYIERFNRTYRNDILDLYLFRNLDEVFEMTENWLKLYNTERPPDSLNNMTPAEYRLAT
ncbi:hypothetical protein MAH1_31860 [Sessilibacter sp. MAH1]